MPLLALAALLVALAPGEGFGADAQQSLSFPTSASVSPDGYGWALTTAGVEVTSDYGRRFTLIEPPAAIAAHVTTVAVDGRDVVVAGLSDAFVNNRIPILLARSHDAGATWTTETLPRAKGQPGSVALVSRGGVLVGLTLTDVAGGPSSEGEWYATADGGATWTRRDAPSGNTIVPAAGALWQTGNVLATYLERSGDGGRSWSFVRLPFPTPTRELSRYSALLTIAGSLRDGAVALVVASAVPRKTTARVALYLSSDGGRHWRARWRGSFADPGGGDEVVAAAIAADTVWIAPVGAPEIVRVPASGPALTVRAAGLLAGGAVVTLSAITPSSAWATDEAGRCPSGKASCHDIYGLFRTADGGRRWSALDLTPSAPESATAAP